MQNKLTRRCPYFGIEDGQMCCYYGQGMAEKATFALSYEGEAALGQFLASLEGYDPRDGGQCSSSIDFPEGAGAPKDFDAGRYLSNALGLAASYRQAS